MVRSADEKEGIVAAAEEEADAGAVGRTLAPAAPTRSGHAVDDDADEQNGVQLEDGEGKKIDSELVRGGGNHARAHPLYSGWNVMAQLSLRLCQGRDGLYYCSNWTTPGNCHDMSLLSGFICAHAVGAAYPFPGDIEANKDFHRLRDLMGI